MAKPWIEVVLRLEQSYGVIPCCLVIWRDEKPEFEDAGLGNSHLQTLEDAWKGLGFPAGTRKVALDESELSAIATYELTALKMMDRLDPDGASFSFNARLNFFRKLVGCWLDIIDKKGINLVVSPSVPHRVFDYALYVAAKIRGIRFTMFQMISFGSRTILIDDIDKMPDLPANGTFDLPVDVIERMQNVKKNYKEAIPKYEIMHKEKEKKLKGLDTLLKLLKKLISIHKIYTTRPNTYWVQKGKTPQQTEFNWMQFYLMKLKRRSYVKHLEKQYHRKVAFFDTQDQKYVLVALHYQPEETSCPTGGVYADQALMIHLLDGVLPENIQILVKEHRTQFYLKNESASGRSLDFYERLSSISDRVRLIPVDADPFELIDQALATVTISGTIGWESAIRGTPAIIFGRAWYEAMPRVFKVKTRSELQQALNEAIGLKNKDLEKEILDFHKSVISSAVHATHYPAFRIYDDVSLSDSVNNLVNGLAIHIGLSPKPGMPVA
jgi:hypothetical protein